MCAACQPKAAFLFSAAQFAAPLLPVDPFARGGADLADVTPFPRQSGRERQEVLRSASLAQLWLACRQRAVSVVPSLSGAFRGRQAGGRRVSGCRDAERALLKQGCNFFSEYVFFVPEHRQTLCRKASALFERQQTALLYYHILAS